MHYFLCLSNYMLSEIINQPNNDAFIEKKNKVDENAEISKFSVKLQQGRQVSLAEFQHFCWILKLLLHYQKNNKQNSHHLQYHEKPDF